jgi:UDP-N-acetylmuramate: L-alanyl-gamma-D-glutamyl-meso-diaminopimelate ligase
VADETKNIYCIAIGGTGMAPLACLLQELGHQVQGADGPLYPPMSTLLAGAGIEPLVGFDPVHLPDPPAAPDLVVVGNAVPRHNPEAERAEALADRGVLERISMPQAIARFLLAGRRPLVVAGTHGKTTTTTMAAWVYHDCGVDPGYLIGGAPQNLPTSFHLGTGGPFVIEGDEYNAAYFDRGPKFLHYQPRTVILTSAEYDHADLYPDPEALREAYRRLLELVPEGGAVVAFGEGEGMDAVLPAARSRVVRFGWGEGCEVHPRGGLSGVEMGPEGSRFRLPDRAGRWVQVHLPVPGRHNVLNAMAVWGATVLGAGADALAAEEVARALGRFQGVQRRLQELGTAAGVTVVDDFAHHPTAVRESLAALARRYPGQRRIALFEPRSLTAGRRFFHDPYIEAFTGADAVILAPIFHSGRLQDDERLDLAALAEDVAAAGTPVTVCATLDEVLEAGLRQAQPGTVLVTMSSGSFEGMPRRLLAGLTTPPAYPTP